jgi:DNA-binding transcriptional ArsR family regulator
MKWSVGQSIAEELDYSLYAISGRFLAGEIPPEYSTLVRSVPESWQAELKSLLGDAYKGQGIIEPAAYLAGVLTDEDYSRVTLAIRELTAETALERLRKAGEELGVSPAAELPLEARLADQMLRIEMRLFQDAGFELVDREVRARIMQVSLLTSARVLSGGDLHARFWHWMDRFYYEIYGPWRAAQRGKIEDQERHARVALGTGSGARFPDLSWLPPQNLLVFHPNLASYVRDHEVELFFWAEPFGIADSFSIYPGVVLVSFAVPGAIYENFRAFAEDVAGRTAALADPTRLVILRLIRQFGMINTEIASYLGLARPTVSIHARILREAGLIRSYPDGRLVRHEMVPSEVRRLFNDLQHILDLPPEEPVEASRENEIDTGG